MVPAGRDDDVRAMSIAVSRRMLTKSGMKESKHCDIFVDEYLRPRKSSARKTAGRHGFSEIVPCGSEMIAAAICAGVIEVGKFYYDKLLEVPAQETRVQKISILSKKFSDEAAARGLTGTQVEAMTRHFTEILMADPSLYP